MSASRSPSQGAPASEPSRVKSRWRGRKSTLPEPRPRVSFCSRYSSSSVDCGEASDDPDEQGHHLGFALPRRSITGELRKHGLMRQSPDVFLAALYEHVPEQLVSSLANARSNLSRSRVSATDFIGILRDQKLIRLAAQIEKHVGDL